MISVSKYFVEMQSILSRMPEKELAETVSLLLQAWKACRHVFILGNGGSAATASHMVNDLSKATIVPGMPRLRVVALTDNISLITAWANDTSYENIFKEQLENLLETGDLVLALSASGNSLNILIAMEFARLHGAVTIGWTGCSGGKLKDAAEHCLHAPTDDPGIIESIHLIWNHLIARELRSRILEEQGIGEHDREEIREFLRPNESPMNIFSNPPLFTRR
jgi:D-sedoheptulose 7-phosphate isomerase